MTLEGERAHVAAMKRTPQPTLTQSRLTGNGMLKLHTTGAAPQGGGAQATPARDRSFSEGDSLSSTGTRVSPSTAKDMDTSTPELSRKRPRQHDDDGMKEFFLQALKINKEEIIKSFQVNLGELARKVEDNAGAIASNRESIGRQSARSDCQDTKIGKLAARISALEKGEPRGSEIKKRAKLSDAYLRARRSIRLWPVPGNTEMEIWGNAGDFLHEQLAMPESSVCQEDVEAVVRVDDGTGSQKDKVIMRFKDWKVRDLAMINSVNLAKYVDGSGRPTAGTRLEIPEELKDTFRLLARFGTRLRARHGESTRRHIKFDDYAGSLFTNIKLPGDTEWTRVTPDMARADLEVSLREENEANQRRMAAKLIPGPRDRLQKPAPLRVSTGLGASRPQEQAGGVMVPSGKRPRWSVPSVQYRTGGRTVLSSPKLMVIWANLAVTKNKILMKPTNQ